MLQLKLSTMDLEYSITPPTSPCHDIQNDEVEKHEELPQLGNPLIRHDCVQCLSCLDCFTVSIGDQTISSIPKPSLKRILAGKDPSPRCFQDNTCELFGHSYVTGVALIEAMSHLFSLARQNISKTQTLLGHGSNWALIDPVVSEAKKLHGQVMTFLQYVQTFVYRTFSLPDTSHPISIITQELIGLPALLVAELQTLSDFIGRISDQPVAVLHQSAASSMRQGSTGSLLLHINLATQWSIVQVLHVLQAKVKDSQSEQDVMTYLNEKSLELFQDMLTIAIVKYNKVGCKDQQQHGLFPDYCLQHLWLWLIQVLDHRHMQFATDSFWCTFHSALTPSLDDITTNSTEGALHSESNNKPSDPLGFCWWLLQNIAPLYQPKQNGQSTTGKQERTVRSHWLLVEDLLKIMLASHTTPPDEAHMQCYLKSCLSLCHVWEPNGAILTLLWGYFHKRLNKKLFVPGQGLRNLGTLCQSATSWYDQCKQRVSDHSESRQRDNSFDLFLRILATQLKQMKESAGSHGWKQLQGRFYSKFHGRSMKELDETGLSRFLSLFLTFALVTDLSDATSRMLDFLDLLSTDALAHGKLTLIWRGLFTLCLIHEDQSCDLAVVADRLVQGFNTVCIEISSKSVDSSRKTRLWGLILSYMEATQEVLDASNKLHLSEERLIGCGLSSILDVASEHEMRALLAFLQTIMARHRILYQQVLTQRQTSNTNSPGPEMLMHKYKALARTLWDNVYPFIKRHASTQTPPTEVADLATSFTLLATDIKLQQASSGSYPTSQDLFHYFSLDDHKVHHSVTIRYLCHLLPNASFTEQLKAVRAPSLVHAWLRCGLHCSQSSTPMQELTRLVIKLDEVSTIMNRQAQISGNQIDIAGSPHKQVMLQFIQALGHQFNSAQTLQERVQKRQIILQYFGDLVDLIQPMLKGIKSPSDIQWIYKVIGHIVNACSGVIYIKGKSQAQLPAILTELILPPALFNPKKGLPHPMLCAIRDTLHLFLEGLASLDLQRDEFIQRKVQEIVQQYFLKLQAKSSMLASGFGGTSIANHPIMVALHKSCTRQLHPQISSLRTFVLRVIRQHFLIVSGQQTPSHLPHALAFLLELLQRTNNPQQISNDTTVLLSAVLELNLLCDVSSVRKSAALLLTAMMDACKKDATSQLQSELHKILYGFLSKHLRVHQTAALRSLETVAVQHPCLVISMIDECSRLVTECERKRGVGTDTTLRQSYCSVLSHLGEEGQIVIARIKNGEELTQK